MPCGNTRSRSASSDGSGIAEPSASPHPAHGTAADTTIASRKTRRRHPALMGSTSIAAASRRRENGPDALVEQAVDAHRGEADARRVTLYAYVTPSMDDVLVDRSRIQL